MFNILKIFSHHYKDETTETAKCSKNKLKQNFNGSEPFSDPGKRKKYNIIKDINVNLFLN